jgi:archaellum component FlaC
MFGNKRLEAIKNKMDIFIMAIDEIIDDKIEKDNTRLDRIEQKLRRICESIDLESVEKSVRNIDDRMETFIDNYKRLENMILEFKGLIAMTRSNLVVSKEKKTIKSKKPPTT